MNDIQLPEDYVAFPKLVICSNELEDVQIPIIIGDNAVFLIGRGVDVTSAKIWLQAPLGSPPSWTWLVEGGVKNDENIDLVESANSKGVYFDHEMLLHVTVSQDNQRADVISLDLRPVGMRIHGNMQQLSVGTNSLVGNHFRGLNSMVKISGGYPK